MIVKGIVINAEPDESVSHGTLRDCDVFKALVKVIENTPEYKEMVADKSSDLRHALDIIDDDQNCWWNSIESYFLIDDLWDICDSYAPEGYRFGSNEGDSSDFGYWKFNAECNEGEDDESEFRSKINSANFDKYYIIDKF